MVNLTDGSKESLGNRSDAAVTDPTATASVIATLKGLLSRLAGTALLGTVGIDHGTVGIDQTTPGTTDSVTIKAKSYSAALTITRPANQTPYTAGDVVGGALTFPTMGPSAGRIVLTSAQLELDIAAVPAGMTSFRLHLYNVTPPSALADNAAWDLPAGDRASYLGFIDVGTPVGLGSTLYTEANSINKQLKLAGTSLFGYLVTAVGYTPAANDEVYVATLHAIGV